LIAKSRVPRSASIEPPWSGRKSCGALRLVADDVEVDDRPPEQLVADGAPDHPRLLAG